MQRISLITIAIALAAGLIPTSAMAYSYYTYCGQPIKWSDGTARLRHGANSFPSGSRLRARSKDVFASFNLNPGDISFTPSFDDGSVWFGNGQSEVWFTTKDIDAPARTVWTFRGWLTCSPRLHETDIQFQLAPDHTSEYSSSDAAYELTPYGGDWRPFATTLMHEMGHAAGLGHENRVYNVMGDDWDHIHADAGRAWAYLGEDASHGLSALYGATPYGMEDLSVSGFKYAGNPDGDEYSNHAPCVMRTDGGGGLPMVADTAEPVYRVRRGQTVRVEFTYENNGKSTQTVPVGFYLSTNNRITTLDRRIGGWNAVLKRNRPATVTRTVTIPANAALGWAWLGAYVDEHDAVEEIGQGSNAAYHRVLIVD